MILDEVTCAASLCVGPILDAVLHVGKVRLEFGYQKFGGIQQREHKIAAAEPSVNCAAFNIQGVGKDPGMLFPGCDQLGTCERCHVDYAVQVLDVFCSVVHSVSKHKASFRITIVHLHRLSREHRQDVIIAECRRTDGIFTKAKQQR